MGAGSTRPCCAGGPRTGPAGGFTLVELVVVMLIVAILGGFATPRFFVRAEFEQAGFAQELAAAARYAQKLAVASGCPVQLLVDEAGYRLRQPLPAAPLAPCASGFDAPVLHPAGGGDFSGAVPPGVLLAATPPLPAAIAFDARGATDLAADFSLAVGESAQLVIGRGEGHVELR